MLSNSLLAEGADGLDADMISKGFESLGAIYSSDVGYDSASLHLRSLVKKELLSNAIINFKKVISKPDFPQDAIERIRSQMLIGIKAKQQSPSTIAKTAFMSALYQSHPYAKPSEGTESTIKAIKRDDIISFYKKYYKEDHFCLDNESKVTVTETILFSFKNSYAYSFPITYFTDSKRSFAITIFLFLNLLSSFN